MATKVPGIFTAYVTSLSRSYREGFAGEHAYRPALKRLVEAIDPTIEATNEPKRQACGAPDFIVTRRSLPIGYIETKDLGVSLDKALKTEQLGRYLGQPNLILTDYLSFKWFVVGEPKLEVELARLDDTGGITLLQNASAEFYDLIERFTHSEMPGVATARQLALLMAKSAKTIKNAILKAVRQEDENGPLRYQLQCFKEVLLHELDALRFADMYAQTICYGLFAAKCNVEPGEVFTRASASRFVPKTNPFLRKLFTELAGADLDDQPYAWAVDDLVYLLNRSQVHELLAEYSAGVSKSDPVLHFYETFLSEYSPEERERRGVYYTPNPVVSYIVRSVDALLRKDFQLDGVADHTKIELVSDCKKSSKQATPREIHKVLIVDPAAGTGTFLHEVIQIIYEQRKASGQGGDWSNYVSEHLLPRLFGFELLMAPYAVAHMKVGLKLAQTGYDFRTNERLGIYLTNTLEEANEVVELPLFAQWLAEEANSANTIKEKAPVMVVLGNPPYSGHSANKGEWIANLLRGKDIRTGTQTANYFEVGGKPLRERNPKWLNDDYVKFIRFAQWRIEQTGYGILAFISNNGYLDNPTFRGMREKLLRSFDNIYILNLHGSLKKRNKLAEKANDQNVFDIQQGVAIGIFVRRTRRNNALATVRYAEMLGPREVYRSNADGDRQLIGGKYAWLSSNDVNSTTWVEANPDAPDYLLVPQDITLLQEYRQHWPLTDIMPKGVLGFQTHRDHFAVDFEKASLLKRIREMRDEDSDDSEFRQRYGIVDNRDWTLSAARRQLKSDQEWRNKVVRCLYRPYDVRYCYFSTVAMDYPRRELLDHVLGRKNLCLGVGRQGLAVQDPIWSLVTASRYPIDANIFRRGGIMIFPTYLFPTAGLFDDTEARIPNFSKRFTGLLEQQLGLAFDGNAKGNLKKVFGPEDIVAYIYAILHSNHYRIRYAEFLKINYPRIPLPGNLEIFQALTGLGSRLMSLHLSEGKEAIHLITSYPVVGTNLVEEGFPKYLGPGEPDPISLKPIAEGRVYINAENRKMHQYFSGISSENWNFYMGGFGVCQKWLKDRVGRRLAGDEIIRFQQIVTILSKSTPLVEAIDSFVQSWLFGSGAVAKKTSLREAGEVHRRKRTTA